MLGLSMFTPFMYCQMAIVSEQGQWLWSTHVYPTGMASASSEAKEVLRLHKGTGFLKQELNRSDEHKLKLTAHTNITQHKPQCKGTNYVTTNTHNNKGMNPNWTSIIIATHKHSNTLIQPCPPPQVHNNQVILFRTCCQLLGGAPSGQRV